MKQVMAKRLNSRTERRVLLLFVTGPVETTDISEGAIPGKERTGKVTRRSEP